MRFGARLGVFFSAALVVLAVAAVGCDKREAQNNSGGQKAAGQPKPATQPLVQTVQAADWCKEHGMPESICVQCNELLAAGFKAKNDWCKEHSRPESQCFECHPELKEKFAAAYKAKTGKEPPAMEKE
jgi:hypothetical protein